MDLNPHALSMHESWTTAASMQLVSLASAVAGVLLGVLFLAAWVAWARRRNSETGPDESVIPVDPDRSENGNRSRGPAVVSCLLLVCVFVMAVLFLPAGAAVRQWWPHPDLGWGMVVCWFGLLLPVVVIWLVIARAVASGTLSGKSRS
jgi:hypothetical protein